MNLSMNFLHPSDSANKTTYTAEEVEALIKRDRKMFLGALEQHTHLLPSHPMHLASDHERGIQQMAVSMANRLNEVPVCLDIDSRQSAGEVLIPKPLEGDDALDWVKVARYNLIVRLNETIPGQGRAIILIGSKAEAALVLDKGGISDHPRSFVNGSHNSAEVFEDLQTLVHERESNLLVVYDTVQRDLASAVPLKDLMAYVANTQARVVMVVQSHADVVEIKDALSDVSGRQKHIGHVLNLAEFKLNAEESQRQRSEAAKHQADRPTA